MEKSGRYAFIFAGHCPQTNRLRAALFEFEHADGRARAAFREILESDGEYVALGTGAENFHRKMTAVELRAMILAVDAVIDCGEVPSVGGDIQYGSFGGDANFGITGLIRKTIECVEHNGVTYGPEEQRIFRYRGFQIYDGWDPASLPLWITPSFLEVEFPATRESTEYFRKKRGLPVP
jgi:hypothetical protein